MSIIGNNILAGASGNQGYEIQRSLRFNDGDSAYLRKSDFGTPDSSTTFTFSAWVKRGELGDYFSIAGSDSGSNAFTFFGISSNDKLVWRVRNSSSSDLTRLESEALLRDPSAWYHLLLQRDSTQSTAADRAKLYINGVQVTDFSTNNTDELNRTYTSDFLQDINIGRFQVNSSTRKYSDGYIAEYYYIDGTALDPSSFTETDPTTGQLIPKKYSGSFGTNGFYLNFSDNSAATAAAIGKDFSGNGHNFTPSNISVTAGTGNDSLEDTPTNNWCTANPLDAGSSSLVFSNGNLDIGSASGNWTDCRSTFAVSSGKWYWETKINTGASLRPFVGILSSSVRPASNSGSTTEQLGITTNSYAYWTLNGTLRYNSGNITVTTASAGDTVQIALDMDNGKIYFGLNNTYFDSSGGSTGAPSTASNPSYSGITLDTVSPAFELYNGTSSVSVNFGQRAFTYTPPTGFKALNTANLPVPTIKNGTEYFDSKLWTGNGTSQTISGLSFQPDWAWLKTRSIGYQHSLYDAVRGASAGRLATDQALAEVDRGANNPSFTSDGITVRNTLNDNASGQTFVGWFWKANGSGSANTDGTISSTVSANADAGFSIVSYTGNASASQTIGHGLGVVPDAIIVKRRNSTGNWPVYYKALGQGSGNNKPNGYLNLTNPFNLTGPGPIFDTNANAHTSSVFYVGNASDSNANNGTYIAYCFAEVEGYSKFGTYTGTGSNDGPFIYLGFRPAFVIFRGSSIASNWCILDSTREPFNLADATLLSNTPGDEKTNLSDCDFLSNGIKIRDVVTNDTNINGHTFTYMAFAETPFKYANAR